MSVSLPQSFYRRNTLVVAQDLLGCFLIRRLDNGKIIQGRIVETEAYIGQDDLACHASKGRTKRTEVMFGSSGYWYVYMIYGMYHCLNVITEKKNFPAAVLIRAVDPASSRLCRVSFDGANGPGKLCRELEIDRKLNSTKAYKKESGLWITYGDKVLSKNIKKSKRIGVDYAKEWANKPWRFTLLDRK